eukprot:Sspe_Gene.56212::Locus_30927_Transcript_1_1_Confidence_1.000_Length_3618::g.56212::m.56212
MGTRNVKSKGETHVERKRSSRAAVYQPLRTPKDVEVVPLDKHSLPESWPRLVADKRQKGVIRNSWLALRGRTDYLFSILYNEFFSVGGDSVKKLFAHTDMRHVKQMPQAVERMLDSKEAIRQLATHHAHLNVTREHLTKFLECLTKAVCKALGSRASGEVEEAWSHTLLMVEETFGAQLDKSRQALQSLDDNRERLEKSQCGEAKAQDRSRVTTPLMELSIPLDHSGWLYMSHYSKMGRKPPRTARKRVPSPPPPPFPPLHGKAPKGGHQKEGKEEKEHTGGVLPSHPLLRVASHSSMRIESHAVMRVHYGHTAPPRRTKSCPTRGDPSSLQPPATPQLSEADRIKAAWPNVDSTRHDLSCFRKRWMELRGQYLAYYKNKGDKPAGLVDLAQCELIDTSTDCELPSPSPFSFALRTLPNLQYPYYFYTDGDNDKELWFGKLKKACNRFSAVQLPTVGERLRVWYDSVDGGAELHGTCHWVGILRKGWQEGRDDGDQSFWVGVELDTPVPGGHSGTVRGKTFFKSRPGHAVLLPAHHVSSSEPLQIDVLGERLLPNSYTPESFDFLAVLGRGSFGRVCKVREKATGDIYACKVLQKAALVKEKQVQNIRREKSLLLNLSHPYIVKLHAAFQTRGRLFLLFDFLSGGELFFHMTSTGESQLSEQRARFYIAEVALAVSYLHSQNILHRDLKAENLVLDDKGHVVLTDFGFAKTVSPGMVNTTKCGTVPYMAPEIIRPRPEGYSYEVDWWALGVVLFLMLTGYYPFWASASNGSPDTHTTMQQILNREISLATFPTTKTPLSEDAIQFCCGLLRKDPRERVSTIEQCMSHPWFVGFDWEACRQRELQPPFVPEPAGKNTKYFPFQHGDADARHVSKEVLSCGVPSQMDAAFTSFYGVHKDHKKASSDDEDREFLRSMNGWNANQSFATFANFTCANTTCDSPHPDTPGTTTLPSLSCITSQSGAPILRREDSESSLYVFEINT